jgi:hypothetical protein
LLVAGLVCLVKNRPLVGILAVGAAVLIKLLPIGVLPLCLLYQAVDHRLAWRTRMIGLTASVVALIGLVGVAYAPFWIGTATLQRVIDADSDYLASVPALIILVVPGATDWLTYLRLALLAIVGLWQARGLWLGSTSLPTAALGVLFATIVLASHFAGWYLGLLVAVSVLTQNRRLQAAIGVFTLTATLTTPLWTYVWTPYQDSLTLTTFHLFLVPFTFIPPLLVLLLSGARFTPGPVRQPEQRSLSPAALSAD